MTTNVISSSEIRNDCHRIATRSLKGRDISFGNALDDAKAHAGKWRANSTLLI